MARCLGERIEVVDVAVDVARCLCQGIFTGDRRRWPLAGTAVQVRQSARRARTIAVLRYYAAAVRPGASSSLLRVYIF